YEVRFEVSGTPQTALQLAAPRAFVRPLEHAAPQAHSDVVGHDCSGGLGEHTGLCDRDAGDIAQRVDVGEPGREVGLIHGHPPVNGEPGAVDHCRHTGDGGPDKQVV